MSTPYHLYILRCTDGSLYTGITTDVEARFIAHKNGTGARYTRAHPPEKIIYRETHPDKSSALKREAQIKKLSRREKLLLISSTH
jgi:predicted GIY-YIG superfamily endonuclease